MTTLTATTLPARPRADRAGGVTFAGVLRSEWIKLRSLRSTVWTLTATVLLMVGTTQLIAWTTLTGSNDELDGGIADLLLPAVYIGQLTLAALGVLAISGEYSTGMIRSTLTAVPRRVPVLWAKALVLAGVAAVVGTLGITLATVASLPLHDRLGITLDLSDAETLRTLGGTPLYLTAIALLGFAVGALLRHSAGALTTVLGLLLVVENVVAAIPTRFFDTVEAFLPSGAGSRLLASADLLAVMDESSTGPHLTAWQGYGVLLAWVAVLLTAAVVLLRRRDA